MIENRTGEFGGAAESMLEAAGRGRVIGVDHEVDHAVRGVDSADVIDKRGVRHGADPVWLYNLKEGRVWYENRRRQLARSLKQEL